MHTPRHAHQPYRTNYTHSSSAVLLIDDELVLWRLYPPRRSDEQDAKSALQACRLAAAVAGEMCYVFLLIYDERAGEKGREDRRVCFFQRTIYLIFLFIFCSTSPKPYDVMAATYYVPTCGILYPSSTQQKYNRSSPAAPHAGTYIDHAPLL